MAEIMVRYDDLRRYCEKPHCGSVPLEYIKQITTIEAEPVQYGRWENGGCTNCKRNLIELCGGEDYELARFAEFDAEFCPFCGARMYGGANNDT